MVRHMHDIRISCYDPRVQEGIPVHRVVTAQLLVERIRIRQYFRIKQLIQTKHRTSLCGAEGRALAAVMLGFREKI